MAVNNNVVAPKKMLADLLVDKLGARKCDINKILTANESGDYTFDTIVGMVCMVSPKSKNEIYVELSNLKCGYECSIGDIMGA